MGEHDDLLRRFQPVLRYDSNEQFFADNAFPPCGVNFTAPQIMAQSEKNQ